MIGSPKTVVLLRLHVFNETQQASGYYGLDLTGLSHLPIEGDTFSCFDGMQLPQGDIGIPLAEVTDRGWTHDLSKVELHIDCVVDDEFFFDRPWRQHLLDSGWVAVDAEDALSA